MKHRKKEKENVYTNDSQEQKEAIIQFIMIVFFFVFLLNRRRINEFLVFRVVKKEKEKNIDRFFF